MPFRAVLEQVALALLYYFLVVGAFRLAGKRLAGQTTTFDLVILISLGVAIQQSTLLPGRAHAAVFVATVFVLHYSLARACVRWPVIRRWVRGAPVQLVKEGEIDFTALRQEGICVDELQAGLRKAGYLRPSDVKVAHLEETGQISAVGR